MGIARGTASVELNDRELARIGIEEQVFIAYGYQPVMISAGCIQKTSASCDGKGGVLSISDRYQKKFAVRRYCRDCYNVMYNSAPLFLADKAEEVHALARRITSGLYDRKQRTGERDLSCIYARIRKRV